MAKLLSLLLRLGLVFWAGKKAGVAAQQAVEVHQEDVTAHAILKAVEAAPSTVAGTAGSLHSHTF